MPVCLIHKLTMGFAVVGVINGVLMQETFKVGHGDPEFGCPYHPWELVINGVITPI